MMEHTIQQEEVRVIMPAEMVQEETKTSTLTQNQAEILADEGFRLFKQIKSLEKKLEDIKFDLMVYAISNKTKEVIGEDSRFVVMDEEKWQLSTDELVSWLEDNKKMSLLPLLVNPVKKKIEHELGGKVLDLIGKRSRKEYAKCAFRNREDG